MFPWVLPDRPYRPKVIGGEGMYALKDLVGTIICHSDPDTAFTKLLSVLRKLQVEVEYENRDAGQVIARCLSVFLNLVLWRCWSDRLLFKLKNEDGHRTIVNVYAVPNLMRIAVRKHEKLMDLHNLVERLATEMMA
jgi:hypothetical protein